MSDEPIIIRVAVEGGEEAAVQVERVGAGVEHVDKKARSAEKGLGMFARGLSGLKGAFGYALGVGGFAGLAFGIGDAVKNAQAFQVATAAMTSAIKAARMQVKPATRDLTEFADSLSRHGGFAPTQNIEGLTALVRITRSVTGAEKDMSLATNIARGAHANLKSAVRAVMMAEAGRMTGLTRLGIILPKHASATKALAILTQRYAGATASYSRTSAGAMGNLSHTLDILGEKVGMLITPLIVKGAAAVTSFIDGWEHMNGVGGKAHVIFNDLAHEAGILWGDIKGLAGVAVGLFHDFQHGNTLVVMLTGAVGGVVAAFVAWKIATAAWAVVTRAATAVQAAFNFVMDANPIAIVVVALAALAGAFVTAYAKVKWFHNAVNDVWTWLKKNWPLVAGIILAPLTGGLSLAAGLFVRFHGKIVSIMGDVATGIKGAFGDAVNWIIDRINNVIDAINSVDAITIFGHRIGAGKIGHIGHVGFGTGNASPVTNAKTNTSTHSRLSAPGHGHALGGYVYGQGKRDNVPGLLKPGEYVATDRMVSDVGKPAMDAWRAGGDAPGHGGDELVRALIAALEGTQVVMSGQAVGMVMAREGLQQRALR